MWRRRRKRARNWENELITRSALQEHEAARESRVAFAREGTLWRKPRSQPQPLKGRITLATYGIAKAMPRYEASFPRTVTGGRGRAVS